MILENQTHSCKLCILQYDIQVKPKKLYTNNFDMILGNQFTKIGIHCSIALQALKKAFCFKTQCHIMFENLFFKWQIHIFQNDVKELLNC
jgi:hypothetical protein